MALRVCAKLGLSGELFQSARDDGASVKLGRCAVVHGDTGYLADPFCFLRPPVALTVMSIVGFYPPELWGEVVCW